MALRYVQLWVFLVSLTFGEDDLCAFEVRPSLNTGLMQQPASQYYHLVKGGSFDISVLNSWAFRGTYLERPVFHNAGYVDQDLFAYMQTGSSFFRKDRFDIYAYAGVGKCWGYIKEEEPVTSRSAVARNDYVMDALALSMEASTTLSFFEVRFGHTLLVGKGSGDMFESNVAWPFAFYYVTLSTPLMSKRQGYNR